MMGFLLQLCFLESPGKDPPLAERVDGEWREGDGEERKRLCATFSTVFPEGRETLTSPIKLGGLGTLREMKLVCAMKMIERRSAGANLDDANAVVFVDGAESGAPSGTGAGAGAGTGSHCSLVLYVFFAFNGLFLAHKELPSLSTGCRYISRFWSTNWA